MMITLKIGPGSRGKIRSFEEERKRYGQLNQWPVGVKPIEVDKIIGSVGRSADFDDHFRWKRTSKDDRTKAIERAIERGEALPPIDVYELDGKYYVIDGHHRVDAAKRQKIAFLDADVIKLIPGSRPSSQPAKA